MALFQAYINVTEESKITESDESWLKNSSFKINTSEKIQKEQESEPAPHSIQNAVDKKVKKSKEKNKTYFVDKKTTREFLNVKTISRPAVSKYKVRYYLFDTKNYKRKLRRYFKQLAQEKNSIEDTSEKNTTVNDTNMPETSSLISENELTQKTAFFNEKVFKEPNNVDMWLEFIAFQDVLFTFEKSSIKGSIAKGFRTNAERKLSILEKALHHNPCSEDLQRKRLQIMHDIYPIDEFQRKMKELLNKDQGNIVLWQGYIEATQCSMSYCNTSSVLKLYISCLSTFHKMRRNAIMESKNLEENILRMLYQCGLFLKQSGLFEQLWVLLKMYLEMNLEENQINFEYNSKFNEKQLTELEDIVFKSQLPSHELWLRTEKLRESCHWLPVNGTCEDPQRIVFVEDVVELIQPITIPENTFRLIAIVLTLLKVPLLPCRHNTMKELGLDYVPWALDSVETLLTIYFPTFTFLPQLENFQVDYQLAVGPQYLKVLPGQEEYVDFLLNVMHKCINCTSGENKCSLTIWWLRFQRLLLILEKSNNFKIAPKIKKSMKTNIKNLMKLPENQDNILFYIEYALIEKISNSNESCIGILMKALLFLKLVKLNHNSVSKEQENACHLVRILVENLIEAGRNDEALRYLVNFALGKPLPNKTTINEDLVIEVFTKFKHITLLLINQEEQKLPAVKHFLPIFSCDWIICNSCFIYLSKNSLECLTFLEEILNEKVKNSDSHSLQTELLHEFYIAMLFKINTDTINYGFFKSMDDAILQGLQNYSNNVFILTTMARRQCTSKSLGPKWWTIKNTILKTEHALPVLLFIFATHQIMLNIQEEVIDTITGDKLSVMDSSSFKNSMLSLFRNVTEQKMCTKQCGLIWRLYLQFVHKHFDPKMCRNVYYSAVEECPWLKALYMDAAIYIPAELGQIQDLIIEKQLRLHITPEELDILRDT